MTANILTLSLCSSFFTIQSSQLVYEDTNNVVWPVRGLIITVGAALLVAYLWLNLATAKTQHFRASRRDSQERWWG